VAGRSAGVTTPIIVGNALDDRWVPPASRGAFMSGYRGTRWQDGAIDPVGS
jgi:predicted alpha/beta hydrolase